MDIDNLTFDAIAVFGLIATIAGWLKIWYSQKEKTALQNREIELLKEQCELVKLEFEKLEKKVDNNREEVLKQYSSLKDQMHEVSSDVKMLVALIKKEK